MGKIVATEYISLDGVVEAPGGGEEFEHAGWSFEIERGQEFEKFKFDETMNSEAQLLGRLTYEGFAAAWPSMEGEFADRFNAMPKYVVSSTLEEPEWNNSTVLEGDVVEEVSRLRQAPGGERCGCLCFSLLLEGPAHDAYRAHCGAGHCFLHHRLNKFRRP